MKLRSAYSWMLFASMYPARCVRVSSSLHFGCMDAMLNPNRAKSGSGAPGPKSAPFDTKSATFAPGIFQPFELRNSSLIQ